MCANDPQQESTTDHQITPATADDNSWETFLVSWGKFSEDFMAVREQPPLQERLTGDTQL